MALERAIWQKRATGNQRQYLTRLLASEGYIAGPMCRDERTGTGWRSLFAVTKTPEPERSPFDWPTIGEWMDSLTVVAASAAINYLLEE